MKRTITLLCGGMIALGAGFAADSDGKECDRKCQKAEQTASPTLPVVVDGDRERRGPPDGERGERRGPPDGERGERRGPPDGERGERRGPPDGERGDRPKPPTPEERAAHFKSLDTDGSGGLTLAELQKGERFGRIPAEHQERVFGRLDADDSGEVTEAEMKQAHARRPGGRRGGPRDGDKRPDRPPRPPLGE